MYAVVVHHFVLPGKNAAVLPPLESFQIRQFVRDNKNTADKFYVVLLMFLLIILISS